METQTETSVAPVCVTVFYMYAVAFCHFSAFNFLPPSLSALLKTCNTVCSQQKKKKKIGVIETHG